MIRCCIRNFDNSSNSIHNVSIGVVGSGFSSEALDNFSIGILIRAPSTSMF